MSVHETLRVELGKRSYEIQVGKLDGDELKFITASS